MGHQTPAISEVTGCKLGVLQTLFCTPSPDPYALTDELARISTCRTQTMGWGLCLSPCREGGTPRSRVFPITSWTPHHSTHTRTTRTAEAAVSITPSSGLALSTLGDGLPLCRDLKDPKAVGADSSGMHSNSRGIHTVLATCPPRTEARASKKTPQRQHQDHLHAGERLLPTTSIYTGRMCPGTWT